MKKSLRTIIINLAALNTAIVIVPGLSNTGGLKTLIISTIILSFINIFVKPIISLLLLPINLITLGTFKWLINVFVLIILTAIVSNLQVKPFTFSGLNYQGFIIPEMTISIFFTLILASATISLINILLFWIIKDS